MAAQPDGAPGVSLKSAALGTLIALKAAAPPPPPTPESQPSDPVRDVALLAMKAALHTDIALLQKRDLFDPDRLSDEVVSQHDVQNQLERVFWKGDFLLKLNVVGATLRKVLKQSKTFDDLDQDALATEVETGRALLSLGVWKDPKDPDSYYVNGAKLDDTLLYSVAASEYLGLGDTGYADLATPDVPPNIRANDFKTFVPIASITCALIRKWSYPDLACDTQALPPKYLDPSSLAPLDSTPGFNALSRYRTAPMRLKRVTVAQGASGAEKREQQRHFWTLNLEYMDFSLTGTYINRLSHVAQTLAGISATGVTTTGSHALGADHRLRGIYDFGAGTLYALSDSAFSISSTTASPVPTIATNVAGFEAGGTFRMFPLPRPTWLMAQYSIRYERQLTDSAPTTVVFKGATPPVPPAAPDPNFPASPPTPAANLYIDPPRISTIYGRAGLRAEFADTYFEVGLEEVDARNLLRNYIFAIPGGGNLFCFPTAGVPLSCGTDPALSGLDKYSITQEGPLAFGPIKPTTVTTDYLTGGAYLNFNLKFPIWSKKDATGGDHSAFFQLTNKFDLYFNSPADTSVQTKYLGKLSPSLNIPIYGKLMLTPKVDFIMYENKLGHSVYRSMAPSLSISYSFKLREGMQVKRSLGYGAITTTPQTAGTAH